MRFGLRLLAVVLIAMMFSCVGCQTVQGIGGDIQWIGEASAGVLVAERSMMAAGLRSDMAVAPCQ